MSKSQYRIINLIILNIVIVSTLLQASPAMAAPPECSSIDPSASFANVLRRVACGAGYIKAGDVDISNEERIVSIIGAFISIALGFIGVIFVVLMIYGGWLWGSARGNEEQVQEAEKLIRNAVLGTIITFATFTLSRFVINTINVSFGP